ncbi:MutS-related protein [Sphingobacterium sp. SGR-19]|uniref:MutS-related protein n=1 Tax=Sphingobacterium sp. SGR-19 TaxID=2710886 RepID=UPI0013EBCB5C|nr:P-loop domain-containing protein [Sphingobacterium sp. SGR-19]NGM66856.1 hypothetical protein [Sphingobacterium sp. SGR-19]
MENNITNVNDLNIKTDILDVFDNTLHSYSRDTLLDMLLTPLQNIDAINNRQQILKGFLANKKLLERYFYNSRDFADVHTLLTKPDNRKLNFRFKLLLLLNKAKRNAAMGIYIQLIIFLQQQYTLISNFIDTDTFPDSYKYEIKSLTKYFLNFELDFFSTLIRENKFKIAHIVALQKKINKLQETETNDFFKRLFTFESLLSLSISIHKRGFIFPSIGDPAFTIAGVYHPLLPKPIRNGVSLDKQVVLITGPNMAGKSTFLKAIAISVYLGHLGIAIPAEDAKFPFFQNICIYINHTDNLRQGYSHFLREVKNLKEVALKASEGTPTFAIFDEIFKGTNMNDALQITRATTKGLAQFHKSVFFISTHMDELKDMASTAVNSYFLDCKVEDGIPKFSYQLKEGWSSVQIGKILFKNEGLYELFQSSGD